MPPRRERKTNYEKFVDALIKINELKKKFEDNASDLSPAKQKSKIEAINRKINEANGYYENMLETTRKGLERLEKYTYQI